MDQRTTRDLLLERAGLAFETVYVFDDSIDDTDATLCARTVDGRLRKVYGPLPAWVTAALEGLPHHTELEDLRPSSRNRR